MARFQNETLCKLLLLFLLFSSIYCANLTAHFLNDGTRQKPIKIKNVDELPMFNVFCYKGEPNKRLGKMFTTAMLKLTIVGDQYRLFRGPNLECVIAQHEKSQQSWFTFLPWQTDSVQLEVFNTTCVGVEARQDYSAELKIKAVDPWVLMFLFSGLVLFLSANRLSKNVLFYYGTGVSVGIVASLLVLVFIISRFLPKKHFGAYALLVGGWSIALYIFQKIWENIQLYLEEYFQYVVGYLLVAGAVSFAICYYRGPPSDPRSLNLVKWGIQGIALLLMFFGTCIPAVSLTLIIVVLAIYNFPTSILWKVNHYWRIRFPPKIRLLTEEEFIKQGNEETQKALAELREYCRSPDCDAWKTISRLQSPHKFADWVEGSSHISEAEFDAFDAFDSVELPSYLETDDEDEIDFQLSSP